MGYASLPPSNPLHHSLSLRQEWVFEVGLILLKIELSSNDNAGEKTSTPYLSQAISLV